MEEDVGLGEAKAEEGVVVNGQKRRERIWRSLMRKMKSSMLVQRRKEMHLMLMAGTGGTIG